MNPYWATVKTTTMSANREGPIMPANAAFLTNTGRFSFPLSQYDRAQAPAGCHPPKIVASPNAPRVFFRKITYTERREVHLVLGAPKRQRVLPNFGEFPFHALE
jgi:hypothetical protein